MTWQEKAAAKRASLAALIPDDLKLPTLPAPDVLNVTEYPLHAVLSPRDLEITDTADVGVLLAKMSSGAWTATEVTTAYCKRALVAHQLVMHCVDSIVKLLMKYTRSTVLPRFLSTGLWFVLKSSMNISNRLEKRLDLFSMLAQLSKSCRFLNKSLRSGRKSGAHDAAWHSRFHSAH